MMLGYKFTTPGGHDYEVLDLNLNPVDGPFADGSLLSGSQISRAWRDADFRICFAKNKTDEHEVFALCIDSLIGVLPQIYKDYFYRMRAIGGEVVTELLRGIPVQFALIDATISAHGGAGALRFGQRLNVDARAGRTAPGRASPTRGTARFRWGASNL